VVQDPDPWGGDPSKRWGRGLVDSFSRPDADVLDNAETGQTWTQVWSPGETKGFGIRSGQARVIPQTVNGYFSAWCPSGQSDARAKVRLTLGTVIGTGARSFREPVMSALETRVTCEPAR
jgi:hypothetical protein